MLALTFELVFSYGTQCWFFFSINAPHWAIARKGFSESRCGGCVGGSWGFALLHLV